jgi:hypothetical protein
MPLDVLPVSLALAASLIVATPLVASPSAEASRDPLHSNLLQSERPHAEPQEASPRLPPAPRPEALFDAMTFDAWRVVGDRARFELLPPADGGVGPTLVGRGPIERNGFLTSPRTIGDFRLSVDVRLGSVDNPRGEKMNSGIQIRSRETDGTIAGLQIEVDPTPRRWSGGVYDERGRGWLASLADDAAAQAAFRLGEWNTYEIECIGPRVRTKVNGVPCAEWYDGIVEGVLAFQVHGGPPCEVAFRAPVLEELGAHTWRPLAESTAASSGERVAWAGELLAGAVGMRADVIGGARIELQSTVGISLASIEIPPIASVADGRGGTRETTPVTTPDERARARRIEAVWFETGRDGVDGAVLVDGARIARLSLAAEPRRIRVVGAETRIAPAEQLCPQP